MALLIVFHLKSQLVKKRQKRKFVFRSELFFWMNYLTNLKPLFSVKTLVGLSKYVVWYEWSHVKYFIVATE